jgi:hypothetical protein
MSRAIFAEAFWRVAIWGITSRRHPSRNDGGRRSGR